MCESIAVYIPRTEAALVQRVKTVITQEQSAVLHHPGFGSWSAYVRGRWVGTLWTKAGAVDWVRLELGEPA